MTEEDVVKCPHCGTEYHERDLDVCCDGAAKCRNCGKEWEV